MFSRLLRGYLAVFLVDGCDTASVERVTKAPCMRILEVIRYKFSLHMKCMSFDGHN